MLFFEVLVRFMLSLDGCLHNLSALDIDIDIDIDSNTNTNIDTHIHTHIWLTEEERGFLLQKLWYSDVQRWAGELMLSVYRATHTAVWAQEIEGTITINYMMSNELSSRTLPCTNIERSSNII